MRRLLHDVSAVVIFLVYVKSHTYIVNAGTCVVGGIKKHTALRVGRRPFEKYMRQRCSLHAVRLDAKTIDMICLKRKDFFFRKACLTSCVDESDGVG